MVQDFYKEVLDSLTEGVYFVDLDRKVTYWNKAAERLSGYAAEEIMGKSCADNYLRHVDEDGNQLCLQGCPLAATMNDGEVREASVYMHHKFGHRVPVFVRASPMRDELGNIVGAVEVFVDNSKHLVILEEMEKLRKEVLTDKLTGIGNRRYAEISSDRLDASMKESGIPFGVVFADIDHFKKVNDLWGHHVGDMVIAMVARTLTASLRPLDVACRWGGEEFVVLIPNTTPEGLAIVAERLRMLVAQSWVEHEGQRVEVTASFGGAASGKGELAAAVIARADKQLYLSKEAGRNCIYINGKKLDQVGSE
ncbi:sensor domain-containing diguanylate cyclase [Salidesulfovibrio onnuriiensis]|uniref:sensor domain-containing diguanylate cyclase n=1 Tax=Salidesulfovibrio onnuriiensis TaxID=2583823 RepID=UPI0011CBDC93|nr:GGDEF domain-containing protein [Salidesulfovibrio onnuriiensis]